MKLNIFIPEVAVQIQIELGHSRKVPYLTIRENVCSPKGQGVRKTLDLLQLF